MNWHPGIEDPSRTACPDDDNGQPVIYRPFYEGGIACIECEPRESNPYQNKKMNLDWFAGWDFSSDHTEEELIHMSQFYPEYHE
jgi:ribosome modulation factor